MNQVRWGIIGCGDVTEKKSGPAFSKVEGSELVAVMRRNADEAADYARRHGVPRWYDDADALIQDPEVDAVYIATPPSSHADYAKAVAAAGKPVYVEKPMARTVVECDEMISACEAAQVPLFVAYYRRALPHFLQVKQWLEEGAIGEVYATQLTFLQAPPRNTTDWRFDPETAGGGLLYDLGSHQLDIIDFLLGPIVEVEGQARNLAGRYSVEDTVSARWTSQSGAEGSALWCFVAERSVQQDEIRIVGSKGRISMPCFGPILATLDRSEGSTEFKMPAPEHIAEGLITTIVAELRGEAKCPSTGHSAARTARIIEAIARNP